MRKLLTFCFFLFSVFICGLEQATACDCGGGANPCSFFQQNGGTAFIGTVTNVVEVNEKYGQPIKGKARKITIKVDEVFKGSVPEEIITSDDGFSCDNFPFSLGGNYLIYSKGILENTENILPVSLCSGTTPVKNVPDSISFLRQLKDGQTPSILYGKVQKRVNAEKFLYQPLSKTKVVLTKIYAIENSQYRKPKKREREAETFTDKDGQYKFENLPSGRYRLSAALPDNLWMPEEREFYAGGKPSCINYSLNAYVNGSIGGNVVSFDGMPVGFLKLNISPIDQNTRFYYGETQTDKNGSYTFYGLSEGKYKIHVYLPGYVLDNSKPSRFDLDYPYSAYYFSNVFDDKYAQIINLANTEKIQNIDLKMPPFPIKQSVTGTVVWQDGTPAKDAVIYYRIKGFDDSYRRYAFSDENGNFSFQIFSEFEYEFLAASNNNEVRGFSDWVSFSKDEPKMPIKLRLKAQK